MYKWFKLRSWKQVDVLISKNQAALYSAHCKVPSAVLNIYVLK